MEEHIQDSISKSLGIFSLEIKEPFYIYLLLSPLSNRFDTNTLSAGW